MNLKNKYDRGANAILLSLGQANEVLRLFLKTDTIESIEPLSGGFSTSNFKLMLSGRDRPVVLKVTKKSKDAVAAEVSVMRKAAEHVPVPRVLHEDFDREILCAGFIVMEFVDGDLLDDVGVTSRTHAELLGNALGKTLAAIHRVRFGAAGWLSVGPTVGVPFNCFGDEARKIMDAVLHDPLTDERLGAPATAALVNLISANWGLVSMRPLPNCLLHSDFNAKNILITSDPVPSVSAVLDWEFAFSGNPMVDVGNFLRFDQEMPDGMESAFISAYETSGGHLPNDHKRTGKLLDLIALLSLVTKREIGPRTLATASKAIMDTMARWDNF